MNDQECTEILFNHLRPVFNKCLSIPRKQKKGAGIYYFRLNELRQIHQHLETALKKSQLDCFNESYLPILTMRREIKDIKKALDIPSGYAIKRGGALNQPRYSALIYSIKECLSTFGYDFRDYERVAEENLSLIINPIKAKMNVSKPSTSPFATGEPIELPVEAANFINNSLTALEEAVTKYCGSYEISQVKKIREILDLNWNTAPNVLSISIEDFNKVHELLNLILSSNKKETPMNIPKTETITKTLTTEEEFKQDALGILEAVGKMLVEKNRKYGDSALNPARIFSRADIVEQLKVRIDSKINRIRNGNLDGDGSHDSIKDLIGYLILLLIALRRQSK